MSVARTLPVLLPILIGVVLRLALALGLGDLPLNGDELEFVQGAEQLVAGEDVASFPFRPPLYIMFVAGVFELFGSSIGAVRIAQCVLEGLSILGLFLLAQRTLGRRVGLCAAWIYALCPDLIAYSHYLWSETLSLMLLVWGLLMLVELRAHPTRVRAVVTGSVWGVLMLAKPYHLFLLPLLLAWVVFDSQRGDRIRFVRAAGLVVVLAVLVVTPWSLYLSLREGRTIVICTTGATSLRLGVNYAPPLQYDYPTIEELSPEEQARYPVREVGVLAFILQEPALFLRRAVQKLSHLWSPNSFLIRYVYWDFPPGESWKYGDPARMPTALRLAVVYATMGANILLTLGFVVGVFLSRERLLGGLAVLYALPYMAMITLTFGMSRYRLPLMLFAVMFTALIVSGAADFQRLKRPAVLTAVGLVLAAVALLWELRIPELLRAIW